MPFKGLWWPGGIRDWDEWNKQVAEGNGAATRIPDTIRNSTNPYTVAMLKAIDLAFEVDPKKRVGAREVANVLKEALEADVERKENSKRER